MGTPSATSSGSGNSCRDSTRGTSCAPSPHGRCHRLAASAALMMSRGLPGRRSLLFHPSSHPPSRSHGSNTVSSNVSAFPAPVLNWR